ncbi:MAG: hypothetical protein RL213_1774 [Bacteroidota bacterium]|jgi:uncharacterized NAD(P)/FAD-binding protein YdhS
MSNFPLRIGIIGGGFCGAMAAIHLLRSGREGLSVILFDPSSETGRGIAYAPYSTGHLLNVRAGNMSAFPEAPDDFVKWLAQHGTGSELQTAELAKSYQPRSLFGDYISGLFSSEKAKHGDAIRIVRKRITGFRKDENQHVLRTHDGDEVRVDRTLLATGNFLPGKPKGVPESFVGSPLYFNDPWSEASVTGYSGVLPVLLMGTGLTMVDVVIGLREKGYKGPVVALSPKGFRILPHRDYEPQQGILESLHPPYRLREVFRVFRYHIREVRSRGVTGEAVVDAVRSRTGEIWSGFTQEEKRTFVSHLRHLWGLARHRLPATVHSQISEELARGYLEIRAGRMTGLTEENGAAKATFFSRESGDAETILVGRVINCTGPQTDLQRLSDPLFNDLIGQGFVTPDPLGMGIHCDRYGHPIGMDLKTDKTMVAIGSLLKGDRWESTAVPELRMQAKVAAERLLATD